MIKADQMSAQSASALPLMTDRLPHVQNEKEIPDNLPGAHCTVQFHFLN